MITYCALYHFYVMVNFDSSLPLNKKPKLVHKCSFCQCNEMQLIIISLQQVQTPAAG